MTDAPTPVPSESTPAPVDPVRPPVAPDFPAPTIQQPQIPARKRRLWPWFLAGGILLFVVLVVVAVIAIASAVFGTLATPARTVTEFDRSFAESDCELFQATTTPEYQEAFMGGPLDCEEWTLVAESYQLDGVYQYEVTVDGVSISNDRAEVSTSEIFTADEPPEVSKFTYMLVRVDGVWLIERIDNAD